MGLSRETWLLRDRWAENCASSRETSFLWDRHTNTSFREQRTPQLLPNPLAIVIWERKETHLLPKRLSVVFREPELPDSHPKLSSVPSKPRFRGIDEGKRLVISGNTSSRGQNVPNNADCCVCHFIFQNDMSVYRVCKVPLRIARVLL